MVTSDDEDEDEDEEDEDEDEDESMAVSCFRLWPWVGVLARMPLERLFSKIPAKLSRGARENSGS